MSKFSLIYITNPTKAKAQKIARHLLNKKLIACANIFPINSLYRWQGKIVAGNEWVLLVKTTDNYFTKIKTAVAKIHPYSIPCIIKISAQANQKYFTWLKNEVKPVKK